MDTGLWHGAPAASGRWSIPSATCDRIYTLPLFARNCLYTVEGARAIKIRLSTRQRRAEEGAEGGGQPRGAWGDTSPVCLFLLIASSPRG
ncbi:hypothetical protein BOTBODRAFT_354248 [Botryobasidium botryosum FD-172 SS1]|uniref:Uncharacterized protein n=1 Tax=Botryobasidium botryosum (strain FD-172 SS1) TaxID=930990 RepID=A0A067MFA0_BOTB1|nr:hypothetical protein BOTBODRAFT_354248 [Botryobasidium botryosum FD-172 SS1]